MTNHSQLMAEERPITLARQHWSTVAPWIGAGLLALAGTVVALALIPAVVAGRDIGRVKLLIGLAVAVIVIAWTGWHYLHWRMQTYLLTDRRIIVEAGVLSRTSESIALDRIQNTVIRRPLGDRMIGAGDIEIESAGRDGVEILNRIPNAQAFYTQLLEAMESLRSGAAVRPPHPV